MLVVQHIIKVRIIETVTTNINGIQIEFPLFIVCTMREDRLLGMIS